MNWVERGLREAGAAVRRAGGLHPPRRFKLAPQPPEGLYAKFVAGNLITMDFLLKNPDGNPLQKPETIRVYLQEVGEGASEFLFSETAWTGLKDGDYYYTGVDLTGADPGTSYRLRIALANAHGETACILPSSIGATSLP